MSKSAVYKKLDGRQRRGIIREVRRNRFISVDIQNLGIQDCCYQTIRTVIKGSEGFNSCWAVRKPFISEANRVRRVQWAQQHVNWSLMNGEKFCGQTNHLLFYGSIQKGVFGESKMNDTIPNALWEQ